MMMSTLIDTLIRTSAGTPKFALLDCACCPV
jgi:hypothetical protein